MHKSVIEAADCANTRYSPKETARRVLRAQAKPEAISDGSVDAALDAWYPGEDWRGVFGKSDTATHVRRDMRAAISAALEHMAKEGE